jgi:hypothetical protein
VKGCEGDQWGQISSFFFAFYLALTLNSSNPQYLACCLNRRLYMFDKKISLSCLQRII